MVSLDLQGSSMSRIHRRTGHDVSAIPHLSRIVTTLAWAALGKIMINAPTRVRGKSVLITAAAGLAMPLSTVPVAEAAARSETAHQTRSRNGI